MKAQELHLNTMEIRKSANEAYRGLKSDDLHAGWLIGKDERYDPQDPVKRLHRAIYERVLLGMAQGIETIPYPAIRLRLARGFGEFEILGTGEGSLYDMFVGQKGYYFDWGVVIEDSWIPAIEISRKRATAVDWKAGRDEHCGIAQWHIYDYRLLQAAQEHGIPADKVFAIAVEKADYWAGYRDTDICVRIDPGWGDELFTITAQIDTPAEEKQVREWLANSMLEGMEGYIYGEIEFEIDCIIREKTANAERDRKIIERAANRQVTDPLQLKQMGVLPRPVQLQGSKALARDILNSVPKRSDD
jgi:hypothetical protein